jgi:hypothetical protein
MSDEPPSSRKGLQRVRRAVHRLGYRTDANREWVYERTSGSSTRRFMGQPKVAGSLSTRRGIDWNTVFVCGA